LTVLEEAERAVDRARRDLEQARARLAQLHGVRIGRLNMHWESPQRLDPVRLAVPEVQVYDVVNLMAQPTNFGDAGVRIDQVLEINSMHRILADSRFYSLDFYRSAIAKDRERSL
jgi:hypothetical protein